MKKTLLLLTATAMAMVAGCSNKVYLSLGLEEQKELTYNFSCKRDITLTLEGDKTEKPQHSTELLDMTISYKPISFDRFGFATIEAECKELSVSRTSFTNKRETSDPLSNIIGKKWQYVVNQAGSIEDYSGLDEIAKIAGKAAITQSGKRRIKDPDMILDFISTQWSLWDVIASANKEGIGIVAGEKWQSILMVPFAVNIPAERIVNYSIDKTKQPADGARIVIDSNYELSTYHEDPDGKLRFVPAFENRPQPYEGSFQTRGMFGFLRNYKPISLTGTGTSEYDNISGTLISEKQSYDMLMEAGFMIPLGDSVPKLEIHQEITIQLAK